MTKNEFKTKVLALANEFVGNETYEHWVYCAGKNIPDNKQSNENAIKVVHMLEDIWEMNADISGCYEGPEFIIKDDGLNLEIKAVSSSLYTLVSGCMAFARRKQVLDIETGTK